MEHTTSPKATKRGLFPSPTYSDSTLSSSANSSLCTPENHAVSLPSDAMRKEDVQAANARFLSATRNADGSGKEGNDVDDKRREQSSHHGDNSSFEDDDDDDIAHSSLLGALDFPSPSHGQIDAASHLGKRSTHKRSSSSVSSRRHSIQPMMPTEDGQDADQVHVKSEDASSSDAAATLRSSPLATRNIGEDFDLSAFAHMSGAELLLSPPRLTVSLAKGYDGSPVHKQTMARQLQLQQQAINEESKRRRTVGLNGDGQQNEQVIHTTPQRHSTMPFSLSNGSQQNLIQQTPPNNWMQMQNHAASLNSSATSSRLTETPNSINNSSISTSIYSSGGSSSTDSHGRPRRRSLAGDRSSEIASLTAGLTIPSLGCFSSPSSSDENTPQPPKSAPPDASANAMQLAQAQAQAQAQAHAHAQALFQQHHQHQQQQQQQQQHHHQHIQQQQHQQGAHQQMGPPARIPAKMERSDSKSKEGKGPDVWPDDVEVAFWEALRLIPKLGRRKVLVHGKPCGRNELIADYIERKTNKVRTRKQVSSHIQVLKNIKKGDPEFQQLIAEPTSEEDFYIPAGGMMYAQTLAGYGYGGLGGPNAAFAPDNASASLFSPYPTSMQSPLPTSQSTGPSPLFSAGYSLGPESYQAPPLSAGITSAFNNLHLPSPGPGSAAAAAPDPKAAMSTVCPILPASFSMWVHCSNSDDKHVYTCLDRNSMASCAQSNAPLPRLPLDSVRVGTFRFPRLAEMYHRLPCQFLHVHVPLSVPRSDVLLPRYDHFNTQLSLTSHQSSKLTSVTSVYSHGKRVLSLVEPLDAPRRISGRPSNAPSSTNQGQETSSNGGPKDSSSSSSQGAMSPLPTSAEGGNTSSARHRYWHQAPFATDFWADFLSRNHPYNSRDSMQSFGKEPSERAALGMAVSGVTIIQEFVVAGDDNASQQGEAAAAAAAASSAGAHLLNDSASSHVSPGSLLGDVVLVVAWDLECVEALGGKPGTPTVSVLTAAKMSPSPRGAQMLLPAASNVEHHHNAGSMANSPRPQNGQLLFPAVPSPLSRQHNQQSMMQQQQQQQQPPSQLGPAVQTPTLLRKRGHSANKPLTVLIPPVPSYLNQGSAGATPSPAPSTHNPTSWGAMQQRAMQTPITPFPQLVHTPSDPPPMASDDDAKMQRERLTRAWASQAPSLASGMASHDLHSPLDMTFQHAHQAQHTNLMNNGAFHQSFADGDMDAPSALGITGLTSGHQGGMNGHGHGHSHGHGAGLLGVSHGNDSMPLLSPVHFDQHQAQQASSQHSSGSGASAMESSLSSSSQFSLQVPQFNSLNAGGVPNGFLGSSSCSSSASSPGLNGQNGQHQHHHQQQQHHGHQAHEQMNMNDADHINTQEWMDQLLMSVGVSVNDHH